MSSDINLLIKEDVKLLKHKKRVKMFRAVVLGSLVMVLMISGAIYTLNQRFSSSSIKKDQDSFLNQILNFRKKEAKLTIVNNRINNISNVLDKRIDSYRIVSTLLGKVPDGISVDNLEFSEKTIVINVSSETLRPIDDFINNLIDMAERKEIINALILNSLDVSEVGEYSVSINAGLI